MGDEDGEWSPLLEVGEFEAEVSHELSSEADVHSFDACEAPRHLRGTVGVAFSVFLLGVRNRRHDQATALA